MAKYNWNIETIKDKIKYLKKLLELEKDPKIKNLYRYDIETLECYLDEYYDRDIDEQIKLLEGYRLIKKSLEKISFTWEDIKEFQDITELPLIYIQEPPKCSLSKEEILELTHDFYKSTNHFFFGNFMKNFKRRYDHIAFRNPQPNAGKGSTTSIGSTKESFINIYRSFTLDDVFTTIHEYMHATSSVINHNHLRPPKNLYMEIDSIFSELIAADYFENIFNNGQSLLIRSLEHSKYTCDADQMRSIIGLIEYEKEQNKYYNSNRALKTITTNFCELPPDKVDEFFTKPNFSQQDYLISYIFALELYKMYLEDKEKALFYLKKIILLDCKSPVEYYYSIKKLGIIPNFSSQEIHKQFMDEAIKLIRRKPKI